MTARAEPAASILVVRHEKDGLQVLLTCRSEWVSVLRGFYVFPGGKLCEADYGMARQFALEEGQREQLPFLVCAIRELFEEVGILYCRTSAGDLIDLGAKGKRSVFQQYQGAARQNPFWLQEMIQEQKVSLALDLLLPFSHWITPRSAAQRYDAKFFPSFLPPRQRPRVDHIEACQSVWLAPDEALQMHRADQLSLIASTAGNLRVLADYTNASSLLRDYARKPCRQR